MFTGLVEGLGRLTAVAGDNPRRLTIDVGNLCEGAALGDSVAIDGCCLTVVAIDGTTLAFEVATESLERTTLGRLDVGATVNLERAMQVGARLGGHEIGRAHV